MNGHNGHIYNENNENDLSKILNIPSYCLNQNALANAYFNYDKINNICKWLETKTDIKPKIAIICGSGLGNIVDFIENQVVLPYNDIPYFPRTTVEGHKGNLIFGKIKTMPLVCMQGRFHPFEGYAPAVCTMPIKLFKLLGVKLLIITNAAGGINKSFRIGDIMCIKDHFSHSLLTLNHPLIGINDSRFGPRFVPVNTIYDKQLRDLVKNVSNENDIDLKEGVYSTIGGPTYETVSDTKLLAADGADVVGMSTTHEATVAYYCGLKVLALSIVTDMTVDIFDAPPSTNHEEVIKVAKLKAKDVEKLVIGVIEKITINQEIYI